MSVNDPAATIRYTTNGSLPTELSPEYTERISITATTQLRARAFAPDAIDGPQRELGFVATGVRLIPPGKTP